MLSLPQKFSDENNKGTNKPSIIVELEESRLENEQTLQADWAANTQESNVDYGPTPPEVGNVILSRNGAVRIITNFEGGGAIYDRDIIDIGFYDYSSWSIYAQGFKFASDVHGVDLIQKISMYMGITGGSATVRMKIYSGSPNGTLLATSSNDVNLGAMGWYDFTFSVQLNAGTQYYLVLYVVSESINDPNELLVRFNNENAYGDGTLFFSNLYNPWIERTWQDLYFRVYGTDYATSGYIRTQTMDLGATPPNSGEWQFDDVLATGTSITYAAWASDTGAFAGEETSLGTVLDGDPIIILKRYYRVKATLYANSNQTQTPILRSIKANFSIYKTYSNNPLLPYELGVLSISSLATTIDTFKASIISQLTIIMAHINSLATYLSTKYPKNKTAKVLIGYKAAGFERTDHIDYLWGQIKDISLGADDKITITCHDFQTEWDKNVPEKWQTTGDDITWTAQHPIDVMLDILQNKINVYDSKIDIDSFNAVKTALSGWQVTRTITGNPENGKKLMEELCLLMSCVFLPQPDGKIKIKRWNANEASVETLTDADVNSPGFKYAGNYDSLINKLAIYYNWDGNGENTSDFTNLDLALDSASITNYGETALKEIKDKWTRSAQSSQITDLRTKILNRYADPAPVLTATLDLRKIYLEAGDIVKVTTKRYPAAFTKYIYTIEDYVYADGTYDADGSKRAGGYPGGYEGYVAAGVVDKPFQIMKRNLDFMNHKMELTLQEV